MSITLKQFSNLIITFIDQNFISIIKQLTTSQSIKSIENWTIVKNQITQVQNLQLWKLQNLLNSLSLNQQKNKINSNQNQNINKSAQKINSMSNSNGSSFTDRWQQSSNKKIEDMTSNINNINQSLSNNKGSLISINSPPNKINQSISPPPKLQQDDQQTQSIEKLIVSFKKLCNNFESNHKKLMRQGYQNKYSI